MVKFLLNGGSKLVKEKAESRVQVGIHHRQQGLNYFLNWQLLFLLQFEFLEQPSPSLPAPTDFRRVLQIFKGKNRD